MWKEQIHPDELQGRRRNKKGNIKHGADSGVGREEVKMPLVRISLMQKGREGFGEKVGQVVYLTMCNTLNVPEKDNFQVITEHDGQGLVFDPAYLDIPRTDGIVFIQITLNEGRSVEMKKAFYKELAETLNKQLGIRQEDVLINLVEVKKENWSFGNGVAQYI